MKSSHTPQPSSETRTADLDACDDGVSDFAGQRVFVDLREVAERDLGCRQVSGQPYQAVNVPRIYPAVAQPGVLLLPHRPSLV
jgi:hypothetical protein